MYLYFSGVPNPSAEDDMTLLHHVPSLRVVEDGAEEVSGARVHLALVGAPLVHTHERTGMDVLHSMCTHCQRVECTIKYVLLSCPHCEYTGTRSM